VLAVIVAAPVEVFELESERLAGFRERFEHLLASGNHFFADAIAGDGCDAIGFHVSVLQVLWV
jgi:hypothetical protein